MTLRGSRLIPLLWSTPALLVLGCFFGAYYYELSRAGQEGAAYLRIGSTRYSIPAREATAALQLYGVAFLGIVLWVIGAAIWQAGRTRISFAGGAVHVERGGFRRTLDRQALAGARAYRLPVGTRLRLSPDTPRILLTDTDALLAVQRLRGMGVACRTNAAFDRIDVAALAPGELVRWSGRPGLRSFSASRGILLAAALLPILIFIAWMAYLWTSPHQDLGSRLFFTFVALVLVGGTAITVAAYGAASARDWLFDALGDVAVTDRRVIWRAPVTGSTYREVERADLIDAYIVEQHGDRGWISIRLRARSGGVAERDLFGVPEPERALYAIRRLIAVV